MVPVSQAMTTLVGEKRKMTEEPPMIPCIVEELNHVLDKQIEDGVIRAFTMSRLPIEEERKNPLFCRIHNYVKHSTKDCQSLRRLFHKKLREGTLELTQQEPEVQRNLLPNHKGKGVVVVVIHGNPTDAKAEKSEGSFDPNTIKTLQKNLKFRSLFNELGFGLETRRIATESLMSIATNSGVECFTTKSHVQVQVSFKRIYGYFSGFLSACCGNGFTKDFGFQLEVEDERMYENILRLFLQVLLRSFLNFQREATK